MSGVNEYLSAIRANNPGLTKYWPGAKLQRPEEQGPKPAPAPTIPAKEEPKETEPVATSIKRGCVPCSSQHVVTCAGLLNEAMRFVRTEGMGSDQVLDDTNKCLMELNSMERVDLRPERIAQLEPWEKELAIELLTLSRETRHGLEGMTTPDELEKIAANLQPRQNEIFKKWKRHFIENMNPQVKQRLEEKIAKMSAQEKAHLVEEALAKIKKEDSETTQTEEV